MPNLTSNLQLNTWLENEVVDFEEMNSNFEKIDGLVSCIESGTKVGEHVTGTISNVIWRYKKYSDKTIEMSARLYFNDMKCNGGTASPYYSGDVRINFPFELSEVSYVNMHLASNTVGWVSDITGRTVLDSVNFRLLSTVLETATAYKQVFIEVKGVMV